MKKEEMASLVAYMNQKMHDIQFFLTPKSRVEVKQEDAEKILKKMEKTGMVADSGQGIKYCVKFTVEESGTTISGYGFADDPYTATDIAKEYVKSVLEEAYNQVVSQRDRDVEIENILKNKKNLH